MKKKLNKYSKRQYLIGIIFLIPTLLLFTVFSWRPIILSFIISFQQEERVGAKTVAKFVGLDNFKVLLSDPLFYQSWKNTILFVLLALLIGYIIPIVLAILINELRHFKEFMRLGYYLPVILPLVVVSIMWKFLYLPNEGLFDSILKALHFQPVHWLQNETTAILSLVIMATWKGAGGSMIIYLAALQGVPPQYYEAAEIDGANIFQRLKNITIPYLIPIMLIMLILQMIGTFQVFTEPFIMTDGGPNNRTLTVLLYLYRTAFTYIDFGVASAMGLILFFVLVSLTVIYFIVQKKFEQ